MRERSIPPQRTDRRGEAIRLTADPRGRRLLLVPAGAPPGAGEAFMRGWRSAEETALRPRDGEALLRSAASWAGPFARSLGVEEPRLTLILSRRVWGTCNARLGLVALHEDLSRMPDGAAREVLLHELCHLREPAHTPAFWRLMTDMMPDWAEWEGVLRCLGARLRAAGS